jgi:hypothetical protein
MTSWLAAAKLHALFTATEAMTGLRLSSDIGVTAFGGRRDDFF